MKSSSVYMQLLTKAMLPTSTKHLVCPTATQTHTRTQTHPHTFPTRYHYGMQIKSRIYRVERNENNEVSAQHMPSSEVHAPNTPNSSSKNNKSPPPIPSRSHFNHTPKT